MVSIGEAAQGFAAVGSEPRIEVLMSLVRRGDAGMTFGQVQQATGIPGSTLAHHLRFLSAAGLVIQERVGRQTISRPDFQRLRALSSFFLANCCTDSPELDRSGGTMEASHVGTDRTAE